MLAIRPSFLLALGVLASALASAEERALPLSRGDYTGDLDVLLERRLIRVLVPYGRTIFFHDRGTQRGVIPEAMREVEVRLNRKFKAPRPLVVALIPTTRDRLLSGLEEGIGDVVAGDITITEARAAQVDFTVPTIEKLSEIVVTGPTAPALASLSDLAGREVHVRPSTSYHESLVALNAQLESEDKPPMVLRLLPGALEDEDMLDMVDVGLISISVVDDWLGRIWASALPKLKLHPDLVVRDRGQVAWAVRKGSPKLLAALNEVILESRKQSVPQVVLKRAARDAHRMYNATSATEMKKFHETIDLFRKYGKQYSFDYLMLAAQGYQESRLDQNARSHVGAIGVMQIMPATGKELDVGDIRKLEPNVHGGTRYMSRLVERYFKDANFDETNRTLFAFASYNAGPGNIAKARKTARAEGVDPDVWFSSVENVVARQMGREPVQYVRNIYKYYVAYKLAQDVEAERVKAIEAVSGKKGE